MHIVDRPSILPGYCIASLASDVESGPYIDTLLTPPTVDPRVYVSRQFIVDAGRLLGFPTVEEHEALKAEHESLTHKVEQLTDQIAEADKYAEAAEYTLRATFGQDTKVRNKPGRKPAVKA